MNSQPCSKLIEWVSATMASKSRRPPAYLTRVTRHTVLTLPWKTS
jgi:hypothetical protein